MGETEKAALYGIEVDGELRPAVEQEWLITNGMGAFASSTVAGCNTRRYHGVLCAATLPPVGRILCLNRIAEMVFLGGHGGEMRELGCNQFAGGNYHPHGERYLRDFQLGEVARWEYELDGIRITKEVQLAWMKNLAGVRYTVQAAGKLQLRLQPFVSLRDFHALLHQEVPFRVESESAGVRVEREGQGLHLRSDASRFEEKHEWWHKHRYAIESERGLDDTEELFAPGHFVVDVDGHATVTIWASAEPLEKLPDWEEELKRRPDPCARGVGGKKELSRTMRKLLRAAGDFVVARRSPDGSMGTTILAGYPWFADWGRDTMIALPGLLLTTGRLEEAKQVLSLFAQYVNQGMIPNKFDDYSNEPHYNTVDASLWFIHAVFEYMKASGDKGTFEKALLPACREIIRGYRDGTRYHIRMDATDGLIAQGDAQTQLTWMDAKCGETAFTPRQGKPVEINALWHHALVLMGEKELAGKVAASFRKQYWISPFRGLADGIDGGNKDVSIRPNQIFAVSLEHSPLTAEQQAAVVEVVRRELLTETGLRSLARSDPKYIGHYAGNQWDRDKAYHNGTVWGWLIGPFVEAYLRVNGGSEEAREQGRRWLEPLIERMDREGCIGQIAEIFQPEPPYRPVGACAQAWSVAEVLRMAGELEM